MKTNKKSWLMIVLAAILVFTLGQSVMAFSDVGKDNNEEKIEALKKLGVVNGVSSDTFQPKGELTYAAGISMIVRGLDLNLDHVRFIQAPKASDNHPNLKDDAWYSEAFIIADFYNLDIPRDVKPSDKLTKEQFAHHLFQAMMTKGDFAFIEIYMMLEDESDVNPAYMNSIQKLLIAKIVSLDDSQRFYPNKVMTRGEAAAWLHDGMKFVEPVTEGKISVEAVNDDVNKVTITAQLPHPGYGLRISSISFEGNQAVIHTELIEPDPDKMYPQVITEVKVTTYVDAKFKPVLAGSDGGGTASSDGSAAIEQSLAS
ncbi:S-layer homology domain-containing protein [Paenibacillus sp. PL2-23]|uniref:S-layer homology domain-containing protein n=1 Tax=Paenibacillus sp. PL2-23 TaxID=2100729 RepID=UPI0030F6B8D5